MKVTKDANGWRFQPESEREEKRLEAIKIVFFDLNSEEEDPGAPLPQPS